MLITIQTSTPVYIALNDIKYHVSPNMMELCLLVFNDINITDDGKIIIDGKQSTISYKMDEWTASEAIKDFANTTAKKIMNQKGWTVIKGGVI